MMVPLYGNLYKTFALSNYISKGKQTRLYMHIPTSLIGEEDLQIRDELLSLLATHKESIINSCAKPKTSSNVKSYINFIERQLSEGGKWYPDTSIMIDNILQHLKDLRTHEEKIEYLRQKVYDIYLSLKHEEATVPATIYSSYNTLGFYQSRIEELQKHEAELEEELNKQREKTEEYEKIEKELLETKEQINQKEQEHEELKKKIDASDNLKNSINIAFNDLKSHTQPLINEKIRLNWLFYVYAGLSFVVLVALIILEFVYLSKWDSANESWVYYLRYYIPVPLAGALLWAFIYQMNRAQRQLVLLANRLYLVDYVEGILMAILNVSPNVNTAADRICHVLDEMIRKYISVPNNLSEETLDFISSKDSIDIHAFLEWAKKVKEVIK